MNSNKKTSLPKEKGLYRVRIKKSSGQVVETVADYIPRLGFVPPGASLMEGETVIEWSPSHTGNE